MTIDDIDLPDFTVNMKIDCEMLARQWLHGGYLMDQHEFDRRVPELAARIQQTIEDYCESEKLEAQ